MTIQWGAYDVHDQFELFEAVCLWLEIEPMNSLPDRAPPMVYSLFSAMKVAFLEKTQQSPGFLKPKGEDWKGPLGGPIIKRSFGIDYRFPYAVERWQLIDYANTVRQRPKFLFPEERGPSRAIPEPKDNDSESVSDSQIEPRRRGSYLSMIKGMAIALNCRPENSDSVGKLHRILELNDIKLSDDTIRHHLREAFEK